MFCAFPSDGGCGTCQALGFEAKQIGDACLPGLLGGPQCAVGLVCKRITDVEGVCQTIPVLGESCDYTCSEGLLCRTGVCAPFPVIGEACESLCTVDAVCRSGTCIARATVGEACEPDSCEAGLRCIGGACAVAGQLGNACEDSTQCDYARCLKGKCVLGGSAGDACGLAGEFCAADFQCVDGSCAALPTLGATCNATCADGFVCIANACTVKPRSTCR